MGLHCETDPTRYALAGYSKGGGQDTPANKVYFLLARIGGFDLSLPPKMRPALEPRKGMEPVRDEYGQVYALPGGYSINLNGDIKKGGRNGVK